MEKFFRFINFNDIMRCIIAHDAYVFTSWHFQNHSAKLEYITYYLATKEIVVILSSLTQLYSAVYNMSLWNKMAVDSHN